MKTEQNTRLGIWLMIATSVIFALQDGISRHLGATYNIYMVVMIRFWFFTGFATILAARSPGGLRAATRSHYPLTQFFRGGLLVAEVCVMVLAFINLGLIESHAVFTCFPLLVAALSGSGRESRLATVERDRRRLCRHAGDPATRHSGVLALGAGAAGGLPHVCALQPAHTAGCPQGCGLGQLFLDGAGRGCADHSAGPVVLGTDEPWRLGLDAGAVLPRHPWPLAADPRLCRGRGQRHPALCLPATGVHLAAGHHPVRRGAAPERHHRRGSGGGGRHLHAVAPACPRQGGHPFLILFVKISPPEARLHPQHRCVESRTPPLFCRLTARSVPR